MAGVVRVCVCVGGGGGEGRQADGQKASQLQHALRGTAPVSADIKAALTCVWDRRQRV